MGCGRVKGIVDEPVIFNDNSQAPQQGDSEDPARNNQSNLEDPRVEQLIQDLEL